MSRNYYVLRRREPWNPFQTWLFLLSMVASGPLLVGNSGSGALEKDLPDYVVVAWGICLLVGSMLGLAGQAWRDAWTGWNLERAGCILVGGSAIVYALVVLGAAPNVSDVRYACCIQAAYGVAAILRACQITTWMNRRDWFRLEDVSET